MTMLKDSSNPDSDCTRWIPYVGCAWNNAASALLRSLLLALGTVIAARYLPGELLFLGIAAVCILIFVLPSYLGAKKTDALLKLSLTDFLTGIANRRALQVRMEEEMGRCSRGRYSLAVLMIDVDNLKQINDEGGHKTGDEALRMVAQVLRHSTRISDVIGRMSGDEFLVLAPQTNDETACALADRIAAAARRSSLSHPTGCRLSLSIGVSSVSSKGTELEELLEAADRAMYQAKQHGGNCVVGPAKRTRSNVVQMRPTLAR